MLGPNQPIHICCLLLDEMQLSLVMLLSNLRKAVWGAKKQVDACQRAFEDANEKWEQILQQRLEVMSGASAITGSTAIAVTRNEAFKCVALPRRCAILEGLTQCWILFAKIGTVNPEQKVTRANSTIIMLRRYG